MERMIRMLMLLIQMPRTLSAAWSVTFENPNPCALKGSSVEFRCSYSYVDGETVHKTAWYKGELRDGYWTRVELSDLPSHQNRSEYLGDLQHDCSLAVHDLQDKDTGYYYFRFDTEMYGRRSKNAIYLSVTELSTRVHPDSVRTGDNVTLECRTTCQLPSSLVWFKDGHPVTKPEFQAQPEDSGNYVCAAEGQSVQSDPVALNVLYPPLNVSVEVSYTGHVTVNSTVTLTCSSVANPAVDNYTWYRGTGSSFSSKVQVGSGQVLSIPSADMSHTEPYQCLARNFLGEDKSAEVLLAVDETATGNRLIRVLFGVKGTIVLLLTLIVIWAWRQKCDSAMDKEENSPDYENNSIV